MNLPSVRDGYDTKSDKRCPRTTCDDYGKRLELDVGQHETHGDLRVRHYCPSCTYQEFGPSNPVAARRSSGTVHDVLYRIRREGYVMPLVYDTTPFPKSEFDEESSDVGA